MMFGMFLIWAVLIALVVWGVSALFPHRTQAARIGIDDDKLSARDILDRRYARGEIAREDYDLMRQDIDLRSSEDSRQ